MLFLGEFRINRDRKYLLSEVFSYGVVPWFVAEMFVGGLEMEGYRIVYTAADTVLLEMVHEGVAVWGADFIHVVDVFGAGCFDRADNLCGEVLVIVGGVFSSEGGPF